MNQQGAIVCNLTPLKTYYNCDTSSTTNSFVFYNQSFATNYDSYTIDYGDGSAGTGAIFPDNPNTALSHAYSAQGLYTVILTLHNNNGCDRSSTLNIFFGRQPAIGFNIPGGAINQCVPKGSGYIEICVAITNVSTNSPFTIYTLSSNDGSPDTVFSHPPPDTVCHRFYIGSCGINSSKFTDAFELSLRASVPCIDRSATVEPIYISKPSVAAFLSPQATCLNTPINIYDNSQIGGVARPSGCLGSQAGRTIWQITPGNYTTPNGQADLGSTYGLADPSSWISGASPLNVTFTKTGTYTVTQIVGNALECGPDTLETQICVDSLPVASLALSGDTICVGDSITASFDGDIQGICNLLDIRWRDPKAAHCQLGLTAALDTAQNYIFNRVGVYPIRMVAENTCDSVVVFDTVVVRGIPTVKFPNDTAICGLATVDFAALHLQPQVFDSLSEVGFNWSLSPATGWNFVGGTSASSPLVQIDFTQYGTYQVFLTVSGTCGSHTDTMVVKLTEKPQLQAVYLAFNDTTLCPGTSLVYKASATKGLAPYQFSWGSWSQGGLGSADSIVLSNLLADTTLYVKVTDALGCTDSVAFSVSVLAAPVVDAGSFVQLCAPDSIQMGATVTGGTGPFTYQWSPATGLSATNVLNPMRSPLDSSVTYTLSLTDSLGCVYSDTVTIGVFPPPAFSAGSNFTLCINQGDTLLSGANPAGGSWSGTGVTGNTFSPVAAGVGSHVLVYQYTDGNNCTYKDSIVAGVIQQPSPNFGMSLTQGCSPLTVSFYDSTGAPAGHQWYMNGVLFSNLPNPVQTFGNLSSIDKLLNIKLVFKAGSGCSDSITKSITVFPRPQANFSMAAAVCAGGSLQATNLSTFKGATATYRWSVSPATASISDTTAANPVFVFPDFNNGFDSTYSVCLSVISADGCRDTACQNVLVRSRPKADFTLPAAACAPLSLSPADQSFGVGLAYQWSVLPLANVTWSGSNMASPILSFSTPAQDSVLYTLKLIVTDTNGCADSISKNYNLYAQPQAGFNVAQRDSCGPFGVQFNNTSTAGLSGVGQGLSFQWDFGNGQASTLANPVVVFTNSGLVDSVYQIQLIAQNSLGCADTITDSISVHPSPRAEMLIIDSVNCAPFTVDASAVQAAPLGFANNSYLWRVLDVQGNQLQQFSGINALGFGMMQGGDSILVQLITGSPFGCKADTATQLFYTIENPVPNFAAVPDTLCSSGTVALWNSSSAGVSHEWFANGNLFSTQANPSLTLVNNSLTNDSSVTIKLRITAGSSGCADSVSKTVLIHPRPLAQFSLPSSLCANDSVQPVNASLSGASQSYRWSTSGTGVNISDSMAVQPFFHFPDNQSGSPITYTVQLLLTNAFGCTDSLSQSIVIHSRPVAGFSLPANGCGPFVLSPTDNSSGSGLAYNWGISPTAGATASGLGTATPQFNFTSPTQDSARYFIELSVTDGNGCVDSLTQTFDVYPKPQAGFTASQTDSCGPLTVDFANTSLPKITGQGLADMTFQWDFGNGQLSQSSTPTVTFFNSGTVDSVYTVQLIATNSTGCSDTAFGSITVRPDPLAELDTTTTFGCTSFVINDSVVKAVLYPGANSIYQWTVLNPKTNVVLQSFTGPNAMNYSMLTSGDTVLVRLVTSSPFGCKADTAEQLFRTIPNPVPGFVPDTTQGCHPLTLTLTDTSSPGLSYAWYINGKLQNTTAASPIFTLTNISLTVDSIYEIKLVATAGTGCKDSTAQSFTVFALPNPGFTATEVCGGDTSLFTNATFTLDTILQWQWDFGDGNSSNQKNPRHAYASFGTYTVSLTATDSRGCPQTYFDTVIVRPNPVADFSAAKSCGPDTACLNRPFSFSDLSILDPLGGSLTSWQWDILNDGTLDYTAQNPQHTFTQSGIFDIKLSVESQYDCRDSVVRQVRVLDPLMAFFVTDTTATCGPLDVVATDSSGGPVSQYLWELYSLDTLGNRAVTLYTSGQQNPNPIPTLQPGYVNDTTYVLKLTVSNCCDTVSHEQSFTLRPLPVAGMVALPPVGCSGFKVDFTLDGHTTGRPDSVMLKFGDGSPLKILTPYPVYYQGDTIFVFGGQSHIFNNPLTKDTTYLVTLRAVNECGDSTIQLPVLVHPNIVQASFTYTPAQGCEDLTVNFSDASFGGNTFAWFFDYDSVANTANQFSDSGKVVSHIYTEPGSYLVAYIVSDGCSNDTAYATLNVFDAPQAAFTSNNNVCEGDSIFFGNQTAWAPASIGIYRWYFGDGDSATQKDPVHVYDTSGTFSVWLVAFSPNGCRDSISHPVTIHDRPDVSFYVENACVGTPLIFVDSTVVKNASISKTTWRLDTLGTFFSNPSPFTMTTPGSYQITLIQESSSGCVDSLTKTVDVFEVPKARFGVKRDTTVDTCGNISAYIFRDSSTSSSPLQYLWDFDLANAGTRTSPLRNPGSQVYTDTGLVFISLTVWNSDSCWDTFADTLFVEPKSRVDFSPLFPEACMDELILFYDSTRYRSGAGNNVLTYLWDFGDGSTSTAKNPQHAYAAAGLYTVKLKVWDPSCVDSLSREVTIHQTPEADILPGNYELCARDVISISSQTLMDFPNGDVVDSLVWLVSDGREIRVFRDTLVDIYFSQPGQYTLGLVAITDKGCRDTADATVKIVAHPTPVVLLDQEPVNARTFTLTPDVKDGENGRYHWDFGNGDSRVSERLDTIPYRYDDRLCRIDSLVHHSVTLTVVNQIENFGQCMDADTIEITMEGYHLNVPNAFAPERNNVEDANLFLPKGKLLAAYRLRVFDEWGNVIFETEKLDKKGSPLEGWNGRYNGEVMPMGAYVWTIDAEFNDGYTWPVEECNSENIRAYGTVTLIR